eukprot:38953_1
MYGLWIRQNIYLTLQYDKRGMQSMVDWRIVLFPFIDQFLILQDPCDFTAVHDFTAVGLGTTHSNLDHPIIYHAAVSCDEMGYIRCRDARSPHKRYWDYAPHNDCVNALCMNKNALYTASRDCTARGYAIPDGEILLAVSEGC